MPDFDTSSYPKYTAPRQMNPLEMMSSIAGTQNAVNQNRLFSQTFAARKAIGDAYQQSIDPKTGELDTNKLQSLVAKDPNAGFMAGQVAQEALARKQAQIGVDTSQYDLAKKHFDTMNGTISSLLGNPNTTSKDVISKMGDLIASGVLTPQIAAQDLSTMPSDPQALKGWLTQHLLNNMSSQEKLSAVYGTPQPINTGSQTNVVSVSPLNGVRPLGSLQNTLSPGEAAAPRSTFANNQPGTVPTSAVVDPTGHALSPSPAGQPSTGMPGAVPGATGGAPPAGPSGPPGFLPSGPKLGQEAAANVSGQANANQGVTLQQTADAVPQRKALLGEMDAALDRFTSGPGADWKKFAASMVNANNPFGNIFDPKSIASQEVFNKQAVQLAQAQFQALGGTGTDAKLDSTMHTSPNESLSKMGNKEIIALLKGNEDAIATKNRSWQNWLQQGHGPETYGQFTSEFNKVFDPRVFQSQYLNQTQKQDLLRGMSKTEQAQFRQSYNFAAENGWVPDARGQ